MDDSARPLALAGLGLLALPVALFALLFFVSAGPAGWVLAGLALLGAAGLVRYVRSGPDRGSPARVNCRDCGAPNPADAEACGHCGEPL